MSIASCSPSSRGGRVVNGGFNDTERVNDFLQIGFCSHPIEVRCDEFHLPAMLEVSRGVDSMAQATELIQ